jgi:glycolate oxidase iron-sulfur subunit
MEGKMNGAASAAEALDTCLLCGACTEACFAKVPTADIVLEGRRAALGAAPRIVPALLSRLMLRNPGFFSVLVKLAALARRTGLPRLAGRLGLFRMTGLEPLEKAEREAPRMPLTFLSEELSADPELRPESGGAPPAWAYFAPCGPNYLFTGVGLATVQLLKRFLGRGVFFHNSCCGLLAYNYGDIRDAAEFAKRNIEKYEALKKDFGPVKIIGDCSSCVAFMKSYEQLFTAEPEWRSRAADFAGAVNDAITAVPPSALPRAAGKKALAEAGRITYHDSCRACHGQGIRLEPREALEKLAGKGFTELPESDWCCGGAGAYSYTQPEMSEKILRRKTANIASVRADTVAVGSTSCLLQINAGLKRDYPSCKAVHYTQLLERLTRPGGKSD